MFKNTEEFIKEYRSEFLRSVGESFETSDPWQKYMALSRLICTKAMHQSVLTQQRQLASGSKRVYYFSMEFLIGRLLKNYLINLGIEEMVREGLEQRKKNAYLPTAAVPNPKYAKGIRQKA